MAATRSAARKAASASTDNGTGMTRAELLRSVENIEAEQLGKRIVDACKRKSMSQAEAARRIGVHPQALSDWVHHRRKPSTQHIAKLAAFIDVTPKQLRDMLAGPRADRVSRIEQRLDMLTEYVTAFVKRIDELEAENAKLRRAAARRKR
jgi:transcriptional regulator with XRE-family HTH domain